MLARPEEGGRGGELESIRLQGLLGTLSSGYEVRNHGGFSLTTVNEHLYAHSTRR
jgi:hypothetical protein